MPEANVTMNVRRVSDKAAVVDIQGEVTASAENVLMDAYNKAGSDGVRAIILNFGGLEYMNSSGIGLLVTLLIRANRQKQRLFAIGLNDHYRQIFDVTRLNEAIGIFDSEAKAVAAANAA